MDTKIAIYIFVVGLTTGLSFSLFLLRQQGMAIAINTLSVSLWSMSRILGWTSAEEWLFYGELIFAVYCCAVIFRAWKNTHHVDHS